MKPSIGTSPDSTRPQYFRLETIPDVQPIPFWQDAVAAVAGTIMVAAPFIVAIWSMKP